MQRWREFQETKLYDFLAALPMIVFYSLSIANMIPALLRELVDTTPANIDVTFTISTLSRIAAIAFISLALVLLVVREPPKARAKGAMPRILAFAGTYLMVAVVWLQPEPQGFALSLASILLILGGMCFSMFALFHLGRSFSVMPEARLLVTNGPYAVIRHPLYLGEAISTLGLLLQYLSPLAVCMVALQLAFQLQRIKNEELVLGSLFPEYETYRLHTARLLPGVF